MLTTQRAIVRCSIVVPAVGRLPVTWRELLTHHPEAAIVHIFGAVFRRWRRHPGLVNLRMQTRLAVIPVRLCSPTFLKKLQLMSQQRTAEPLKPERHRSIGEAPRPCQTNSGTPVLPDHHCVLFNPPFPPKPPKISQRRVIKGAATRRGRRQLSPRTFPGSSGFSGEAKQTSRPPVISTNSVAMEALARL